MLAYSVDLILSSNPLLGLGNIFQDEIGEINGYET